MKYPIMENQRFGSWTTVEKKIVVSGHRKRIFWRCICECGAQKDVSQDNLICGRSRSCGCRRGEAIARAKTKHDQCYTRLYEIWTGMKERCYNPAVASYKDYGGRGIKVCDEWVSDYRMFSEWALANGYTDSLTIDRIDNNKDYCPENCRWSDRITQANNKRTNINIEWKGEVHTLAEWCRILGLPYKKTHARYKYYHWEIDTLFQTA